MRSELQVGLYYARQYSLNSRVGHAICLGGAFQQLGPDLDMSPKLIFAFDSKLGASVREEAERGRVGRWKQRSATVEWVDKRLPACPSGQEWQGLCSAAEACIYRSEAALAGPKLCDLTH